MPDDKLTPADPEDLAAALAFALRYAGRKRVHNADSFMADLVAKRVRHLDPSRLRRDEEAAERRSLSAWARIRDSRVAD